MSPELSRRVAQAFQTGVPNREERELLTTEASRRSVTTVNDLSSKAQATLLELERRGREEDENDNA